MQGDDNKDFLDYEKLIRILIDANNKQAKSNQDTLNIIKQINKQNAIRDAFIVIVVLIAILLS